MVISSHPALFPCLVIPDLIGNLLLVDPRIREDDNYYNSKLSIANQANLWYILDSKIQRDGKNMRNVRVCTTKSGVWAGPGLVVFPKSDGIDLSGLLAEAGIRIDGANQIVVTTDDGEVNIRTPEAAANADSDAAILGLMRQMHTDLFSLRNKPIKIIWSDGKEKDGTILSCGENIWMPSINVNFPGDPPPNRTFYVGDLLSGKIQVSGNFSGF